MPGQVRSLRLWEIPAQSSPLLTVLHGQPAHQAQQIGFMALPGQVHSLRLWDRTAQSSPLLTALHGRPAHQARHMGCIASPGQAHSLRLWELSGTILTSPDGITWTTQASGTFNWLHGITWSGTQFAAVGDSATILTSPDGITWTTQSSDTTSGLNGITWSGTAVCGCRRFGHNPHIP